MKTASKIFTRYTISAFILGAVFGFWGIGAWEDATTITGENISGVGVSLGVGDEVWNSEIPPVDSTEKNTETRISIITGEDNNLVVSNQPEGNTVTMSMIAIETNGWVAIHEQGVEEELGNILGARRFQVGKYFGEKIELLRATQKNNTYFAVLHADDGDGEFMYKNEIPLQTLSGEIIKAEFIATSSAEDSGNN